MEKSYQVSVGNKNVNLAAPVIMRLQLVEPAPDPAWVNWLTQGEAKAEEGLVLRRIGGVALIVGGLPVGIFGLLCFPGLLFWILGPVALAMIGKGILLTFSKRTKSPEEAFRNLFKEAFFNADLAAISFSPQLFRSPELVKKRIHDMRPIDGIEIRDDELITFMNNFESMVRKTFYQCAGPEVANCSYGVSVDPVVQTLGKQGPLSCVQGVINVIRQNDTTAQIIEIQITMNMVDINGFQMPVNLVPRFLSGAPREALSAQAVAVSSFGAHAYPPPDSVTGQV